MSIFSLFKRKNTAFSNENYSEVTPAEKASPSAKANQEEVVPIEKIIQGMDPVCDGLYPLFQDVPIR